MTVISSSDAQVETWTKKLTTNTEFTIGAAASDNISYRLESVIAACDATSTQFYLWIDDGAGTNIYIVNGFQIPANTPYQVKDHPIALKSGWTFKCKAGTANHIDVTVALAKTSKSKPPGGM